MPDFAYLYSTDLKISYGIYFRMKDRLEYIVFLGFSYLTKVLGLQISRRFSHVIAAFFYYFLPIRKKVVIENLVNAFPGYSAERIKKITFGVYKSFAITLIETLYIPHISKNEMAGTIKCRNIEMLKEKMNEKKGTVLLSAHFGNWEYLALSVAIQLNTMFYLVTKPQRNPYVTKFLDNARTRWDNKVIPMGVSIRQAFKVLKENQFLALAADQRGHPDSIRINFFGRPASVYSGPAVLALKSGSSIVISLAYRLPNYDYEVEFSDMRLDDLPENENEKIETICKRYLNHLENLIRKYPEQWLWMHKRWKY